MWLYCKYNFIIYDFSHSICEIQNLYWLWTLCRTTSSDSLGHDMSSHREHHGHEEWHSDLLGCCSEPSLCMSIFMNSFTFIIIVFFINNVYVEFYLIYYENKFTKHIYIFKWILLEFDLVSMVVALCISWGNLTNQILFSSDCKI